MIKHFIYVWLIYWALVLFLPTQSIYPAVFEAFALQVSFLALVLFGFACVYLVFPLSATPSWGVADTSGSLLLGQFSLLLSILGTCFLIYDRIYIQDIDFSNGVAVAREAWRKEGEARGGQVSSVFSVMGYLFSSGYFVTVVLLIRNKFNISQSSKFLMLVGVFVLLMVNSLIAGGRSNVLLIAVFVFGASISISGWRFSYYINSRCARWVLSIVAFLSAAYTIYIFYQRAEASDYSMREYMLSFLPFLGLESNTQSVGTSNNNGFSSVLDALLLAFSYLTHSFSTTAAIVDQEAGEKTIVFLHFLNILHKLGLIDQPDSAWFLAGRFTSLPGGLWHQYGWLGFSIGAFFVGVFSGVARLLYIIWPHRILPLMLFISAYSVLILSPLLSAVDFMSFPFIILSFLQIALLKLVVIFLRSVVPSQTKYFPKLLVGD